jgi:hypothetical protein
MLKYKKIELKLVSSMQFSLFNQSRHFNTQTLRNLREYLKYSPHEVQYSLNESGFVRTSLPKELYSVDEMIIPSHTKLRLNYWLQKGTYRGETIHDHPNPFASCILNGSYSHTYYKVTPLPAWLAKLQFPLVDSAFSSTPLGSLHFKFSLQRKTEAVAYHGRTRLTNLNTVSTKIGDIVKLDDKEIHCITSYKRKTLSLNAVSNTGKGHTNLFFTERDSTYVHTKRSILSKDIARQATNEIVEILEHLLTP